MAKTKERTELLATQALLQRAHDYIEAVGFDINDYEAPGGRCCYIGAVRKAAGVSAAPPEYDAAAGDGPELARALRTLDKLVRHELSPEAVVEIKAERDRGQRRGRYVEKFGFQTRSKLRGAAGHPGRFDATDEAEQEQALATFRRALTRVHRQIEALDA